MATSAPTQLPLLTDQPDHMDCTEELSLNKLTILKPTPWTMPIPKWTRLTPLDPSLPDNAWAATFQPPARHALCDYTDFADKIKHFTNPIVPRPVAYTRLTSPSRANTLPRPRTKRSSSN
jgi:hypothetical protein